MVGSVTEEGKGGEEVERVFGGREREGGGLELGKVLHPYHLEESNGSFPHYRALLLLVEGRRRRGRRRRRRRRRRRKVQDAKRNPPTPSKKSCWFFHLFNYHRVWS